MEVGSEEESCIPGALTEDEDDEVLQPKDSRKRGRTPEGLGEPAAEEE
jgi:hypothetical protein